MDKQTPTQNQNKQGKNTFRKKNSRTSSEPKCSLDKSDCKTKQPKQKYKGQYHFNQGVEYGEQQTKKRLMARILITNYNRRKIFAEATYDEDFQMWRVEVKLK
jgi:hypothetical protein